MIFFVYDKREAQFNAKKPFPRSFTASAAACLGFSPINAAHIMPSGIVRGIKKAER